MNNKLDINTLKVNDIIKYHSSDYELICIIRGIRIRERIIDSMITIEVLMDLRTDGDDKLKERPNGKNLIGNIYTLGLKYFKLLEEDKEHKEDKENTI